LWLLAIQYQLPISSLFSIISPIGDFERKLWNEIEPPIRDVLDELKANGKIEALYTQAELNTLGSVLWELDILFSAHID